MVYKYTVSSLVVIQVGYDADFSIPAKTSKISLGQKGNSISVYGRLIVRYVEDLNSRRFSILILIRISFLLSSDINNLQSSYRFYCVSMENYEKSG